MTNIELGNLIRGLRENVNMSQEELASGIVERNYLSRIEEVAQCQK